MRHVWILLLAVTLAACSAQAPQDARRLQGSLAPTVEQGGWLLKTEEGDFLLLDLQDYASHPWFKAGAVVKVTGRVDEEAVSIYMQGTPLRVESMEQVED